jgi:hypothetical protein
MKSNHAHNWVQTRFYPRSSSWKCTSCTAVTDEIAVVFPQRIFD